MNQMPAKNFPIMCVGGSAGGLDANIRLLQDLPADMGVAIGIVNHVTIVPMPVALIVGSFCIARVEGGLPSAREERP